MKHPYKTFIRRLWVLFFLFATTLSFVPLGTAATPLPADLPMYRGQFGSTGSGDGQFNQPQGIVVDQGGNIYVADSNNHRIQKFDSNGSFVMKWGSSGSGDGQFNQPQGIVVDQGGNIYVADSSNHRIQKFNSTGTFLAKWGSFGVGDGQFILPRGITTDAADNIYVTDLNDRIQKFDSNGNFIMKWGSSGSGDGQFNQPQGIAVDQGGNIYVVDTQSHRIQKFDSNGNFIMKWGSFGGGTGQFNGPVDIALDTLGNIYVADSGHVRIKKFDQDGAELGWWSVGASNFGIIIDGSDNVYVSAAGNVIKVFSYPVSTQSVSSVENNTPITLTTPHSTDITCATALSESTQTAQDSQYQYPLGLIDFCFNTEEEQNEVTLTFVTDLTPDQVIARKYNTTTNSYFTIEDAVITQTTHEGQPALQLTYTIEDNGILDLDPIVGQIKDPVGLAVVDAASPTAPAQGAGVSTGSALASSGSNIMAVLLLGAGLVVGATVYLRRVIS